MRKKCLLFVFFLGLVFSLFTFSEPEETKNRPGLSLQETFEIYVRAIHNADLESLFTTVTDEEKFFFLTSTGRLIDTRQGYYRFHEDWFKEKDWEMPVDSVEVHEGKDFGYTTAIFHYKSKLPQGGSYNLDSYFTLIFQKEDGMWKVAADVCTPIQRYTTHPGTDIRYTSEQAYLFDTIKNRRTVRKFKPTPVPEAHILKIIEAAHFAPTAGNQQPWKFLVVRDRKKLDTLKKEALVWYTEKYQKRRKPTQEELTKVKKSLQATLQNVLSAPVYVAVLVDSEANYPDYVINDGTLAAGTLMIAARALGYGTGFFTSFFPEDKMKAFFQIPDRFRLICFTPIGLPDEQPEIPDKKKIEGLIVFEKFHEDDVKK
jgi:nitroreductase/ketosteroid isomerase-like protein